MGVGGRLMRAAHQAGDNNWQNIVAISVIGKMRQYFRKQAPQSLESPIHTPYTIQAPFNSWLVHITYNQPTHCPMSCDFINYRYHSDCFLYYRPIYPLMIIQQFMIYLTTDYIFLLSFSRIKDQFLCIFNFYRYMLKF